MQGGTLLFLKPIELAIEFLSYGPIHCGLYKSTTNHHGGFFVVAGTYSALQQAGTVLHYTAYRS